MTRKFVVGVAVLFAIFIFAGSVFAVEPVRRIDLTGTWKFNIDPENKGLNYGWQKPNFDGSKWRYIAVPGDWASQKVIKPGTEEEVYSGFGWYRRQVTVPKEWQGKNVFLNLGKTGGRDWTYINGMLVGHTENEGAGVSRSYVVPSTSIRFGQPNIIVIRMEGSDYGSGVLEGPVSLTVDQVDTIKKETKSSEDENQDAVKFGGQEDIEKDQTLRDVVHIFGDVIVRGHVEGDAISILGSVKVMPGGRIDGDAVALFGGITVLENGGVGGDVVSIGGAVSKDPGAHIGGDVANIGLGNWWSKPSLFGLTGNYWVDFLNKLLYGIAFALLAAVITALFPRRMEVMAETMMDSLGLSAKYGIVGLLIVVIGGLILIGTCIGIPLAVVPIIISIVAWTVGKMAVGLALGKWLGDSINRPGISSIVAVLIGTIVLALIRLVPFAGGLIAWVLALIGFGAVLLTGFGTSPTWWPDRRSRRNQVVQSPPSQ